MSRPGRPGGAQDNALGNPVAIAVAIAQLAQGLGLFNDKKAGYKAFDGTAKGAVAAHGLDLVGGAKALGVDPNEAATAAAYYLQLKGVSVSPSALLAISAPGSVSGLVQNNLPLILAAGGGTLALFLLMKRK